MRAALAAAIALITAGARAPASADELSGADKLRVVYSNQFAWTEDGLPLVTVRVAEGRDRAVIRSVAAGSSVRLQPDGEGGAEVSGGAVWTLRVSGGRPARLSWHVVVGRTKPGEAERARAELAQWRQRGFQPRSFEIGAIFGMRGETLDSREILCAVAPQTSQAGAERLAAELGSRWHVATSLYPELRERPRGLVEASDEHGVVVKNDGILWFSPARGGLLELEDVDREGGGREHRRYFGKLYVTVDAAGKLAVVNAVPEDKLLAGLVPAEMPPAAPPEALKAQAVAARNELLAKLGTRHLTAPYRLCSTQHCQVYAGAGHEDPRSTAAVAQTRGELLERDSGGLVDAVYSACCGGHTEDNERAWGGAPDASLRGRFDGDDAGAPAPEAHLGALSDAELNQALSRPTSGSALPYCARARSASYRWQARLDVAEIEARAGLGALSDVRILERGVSGRAVRLRLSGERGTREVRGELEIRRALGGKTLLKSALVSLAIERDASGHVKELAAAGGGHGHGIGMCQLGAMGMAQSGKSYIDILRHYYRAAHLRRLY